MTSADLLQGLIEATVVGSAAILLVLMLRRPLRHVSGVQVAYALWLLVPMSMLATLLPGAEVAFAHAPVTQVLMLPPTFAVDATPAQGGMGWHSLLLVLWLLGALLFSLWAWRQQERFRRSLGHLQAHEGVLRAQKANAGLPATLGVWRPQVVLPADFDTRYDIGQRALMLQHEHMHITRGDLHINAMALLLRCLLWFNPLFHLAIVRMRHDQELVCDASVLAGQPHARRCYGSALLKAQMQAQASPLGCHFGFGHPLRERIAMLATSVTTLRRRLGGGVLACLLLAGTYAAWAAQPADSAAVPAKGIAADIMLKVDEGEPRHMRILTEEGKPFSLQTDQDGRRFVFSGTVSRTEHQGVPALKLAASIDENGKRVAEPTIVVRNGKPGTIQSGTESLAADGRKTFKGLLMQITLTDALAKAVPEPRPQDRRASIGPLLTPPSYPAEALKLGLQGTTLLIVDVDADSKISGTSIERSSGDAQLDQAALEAVRHWKFNPDIKDGKAVATRLRVPVKFTLDKLGGKTG